MSAYAQVSEQWNPVLEVLIVTIRSIKRQSGGQVLVPTEEIIMSCPLDKLDNK